LLLLRAEMSKHIHIIARFHRWRLRNMSERGFITALSIIVGVLSGMAAVVIKNSVRLTQHLVHTMVSTQMHNYIYFALPLVGIILTVLVVKYVIRNEVRHGIPNVLYSISKRKGLISNHNLFSSVVASSLTVGFGGSVGLEGPTVATGTAWGSWLAKYFRLSYKNTILMLACACAGAMAAIFKAPIAAIVFAVEVIMIDLTVFSLVPLLLASETVISGGYKLFVPLMVTATFAYIIVRTFTPNSVYHYQLASRKELLTHDKDANVLQMLVVKKLIETDFEVLSPDATLRDLTVSISHNHRNLFPVVDKNGTLVGMVKMDDVRDIIFKHELYDTVKISELMYMPTDHIDPNDNMETVAHKFESSGRYNLAVIENGKYIGFISRARVFTTYRKQIIDVSHV